MTFVLGKESFDSVHDYKLKVFESIRKNGSGSISPLALFGYKDGFGLNYEAYIQIGFKHPREEDYYDINIVGEGESEVITGNPKVIEKFQGIRKSKSILDPIEIYLYNKSEKEKHIVVLDGMTRSKIIALLRSKNPEDFQRVNVVRFAGSEEEARFRMVTRNLENLKSSLSDFELMQFCIEMKKAGLEENEIADKLGKERSFTTVVYSLIKMSENLIPELKDFLKAEIVPRQVFIEAAKSPVDQQKNLMLSIASGIKTKASQVRNMNPDRIVRIAPRLKALTNASSDIEQGMMKQGIKDKELERLYDDMQRAIATFQGAFEKFEKKNKETK